MECVKCKVTDDQRSLKKCPICFKYFCEECGVNRSGRWFCSKQCSDFFFFGEDE